MNLNERSEIMAQNFISKGEVITLTAKAIHASGKPYRISGFNGVALISVEPKEQLAYQISGIFEFTMPDIEIGNLIYIDPDNNLTLDMEALPPSPHYPRKISGEGPYSRSMAEP